MTRPCADCQRPVGSATRGLCHNCYARHHRAGTVDTFPTGTATPRPTCSMCPLPADAGRGLCDKHYSAHRTRQVAYGRWDTGHRDPQAAIDHIEALCTAGMSMLAISTAATLSQGTVQIIRRGGRDYITADTEAKILAVTAPDRWRGVTGGSTIDQTGTARRLQALAAIGWTGTALAAESGMMQQQISFLTKGARPVAASVAERVAGLYDRLSMLPGPSESARKRAEVKGWARPLEWDDETIDDPDGVPDFGTAIFSARRNAWWRGQPCRAAGCSKRCGGGGFLGLCRRHYLDHKAEAA